MKWVFICILIILGESALIGIDLGSELIKTLVITPGRRLELPESPNSRSSMPHIIAFNETRLYGEPALFYLIENPQLAVEFNQIAIGKDFAITDQLVNQSVLNNFMKSQRNGVSYDLPHGKFSSEEILAMQLSYFKAFSEKSTIKDCVITVPSFSSQLYRKTVVKSAEIARFNVVALINENTASILTYALDRLDNTPAYVIVYNIGASYIQASLFRLSTVKINHYKITERKNEVIEAISHSTYEHFGGLRIDNIIAEFISQQFIEKNGADPRSNLKAKARIMKEANRVKKVLSNEESVKVHFHELFNGIDFDVNVERSLIENFVNANSEIFMKPINEVLAAGNIGINDVNSIELVGGVTRIPGIQQILARNFKEPSTNLNGDEAIAAGAALYGANFSSEVQIRQVWLTDSFLYDAKLEIFYRDSNATKTKDIFHSKSPIGSVKKVSFTSDEDLELKLLVKYDKEYEEIMRYTISDLKLFTEKYQQVPLLVLEFKINEYGIIELSKADARVEVEVEYREYEDVQDPVERAKNPKKKGQDKKADKPKPSEESAESQDEDEESSENNSTKLVYKKKQFKLDLSLQDFDMESPKPLTDQQAAAVQRMLEQFSSYESEQKERIELKTDLESYIQQVHSKLEDLDFHRFLSPLHKNELLSLLNSTSKWLESTPDKSMNLEVISEKKTALQEIVEPAEKREKDKVLRKDAVLKGYEKLNKLYVDMDYLNLTKTWIELETRENALKSINETINWMGEKESEQNNADDWQVPVLKLSTIEARILGVERKIEIIRNTPRPKKQDL